LWILSGQPGTEQNHLKRMPDASGTQPADLAVALADHVAAEQTDAATARGFFL